MGGIFEVLDLLINTVPLTPHSTLKENGTRKCVV
jgi:hypothetical protein